MQQEKCSPSKPMYAPACRWTNRRLRFVAAYRRTVPRYRSAAHSTLTAVVLLIIACANEFPRALTELPESAHVKLRLD